MFISRVTRDTIAVIETARALHEDLTDQRVMSMIKANITLNTQEIAGAMSNRIIEAISDSEELEHLTPKQVAALSNIIDHAITCELEKISTIELVTS